MSIQMISGVAVFETGERLDVIDGQKLKDMVNKLPSETGLRLVVDMGKTRFMDSSGCGGLVWCLRKISSNNGEIKIARPNETCLQTLTIAKLHRLMDIHNTLESAVKSFEK